MIEAAPPLDEYLLQIAATMRPADVAEIDALGVSHTPIDALRKSVAISTHSAVFLADGVPLCAFGVAPSSLINRIGTPWLLGSVALEQHVRELLVLYPRYIRHMLGVYPSLENRVHADNRRAVRWLQASGFQLDPPAPYGLRGKLFHKFTMKA